MKITFCTATHMDEPIAYQGTREEVIRKLRALADGWDLKLYFTKNNGVEYASISEDAEFDPGETTFRITETVMEVWGLFSLSPCGTERKFISAFSGKVNDIPNAAQQACQSYLQNLQKITELSYASISEEYSVSTSSSPAIRWQVEDGIKIWDSILFCEPL